MRTLKQTRHPLQYNKYSQEITTNVDRQLQNVNKTKWRCTVGLIPQVLLLYRNTEALSYGSPFNHILITSIIIIIVIIISFMQGIGTYIPETNYFPREYSVAAIPLLLFMVRISLVSVLNLLYFTLVLSEVCVQCPILLFSVVP